MVYEDIICCAELGREWLLLVGVTDMEDFTRSEAVQVLRRLNMWMCLVFLVETPRTVKKPPSSSHFTCCGGFWLRWKTGKRDWSSDKKRWKAILRKNLRQKFKQIGSLWFFLLVDVL